ncbi:MAG TPA: hypothetical protein VKD08_09300 [Ignavibacteriaceae bacterium]|jgi:hypothetical protein|nr:hypothetical protein [Ignavibacteriaceae bacterium]
MAQVASSILGALKGRIGNYILRIRYGKQIAYLRPLKHRTSKSTAAKRARSNFASTVAIAKSANAQPRLKEIWKNAKVPGVNSYQRLIKNNAKRVSNGLLTTSNKITPDGLPLKLNSAAVENNKFFLSFDCPPGPDISFPAFLSIFLYFGKESGTIIPLSREISEPSPGGIYNFEALLDSNIKRLLSKDPSPIVYIALAGGTAYKKKVYWTSTASAIL